MKDLIIGCSTNYNWDTLKYWVNSINQSGFDGHKVLILMNCDKLTFDKVVASGFDVVCFAQDQMGNLTYNHGRVPVHVERFFHIFHQLESNSDYRYVITTDVKDVVFQKNPVEWLEENLGDKNCVFSSESLRYEDEPWGDQNLLETYGGYIHSVFKKNEIFNVGVLAGKADAMKALALNIFTSSINRPIPICDQSTFNFMISQEPYLSTNHYLRSEDGWACQLGTTADPSKIEQFNPKLLEATPKMENGKVTTSLGKEFTIVHQYDRIPEWRKMIEKTYE